MHRGTVLGNLNHMRMEGDMKLLHFYGFLCNHMSHYFWPNCVLSINSIYATGLILYSLKSSRNIWFSDVFKGHRKRPVVPY